MMAVDSGFLVSFLVSSSGIGTLLACIITKTVYSRLKRNAAAPYFPDISLQRLKAT